MRALGQFCVTFEWEFDYSMRRVAGQCVQVRPILPRAEMLMRYWAALFFRVASSDARSRRSDGRSARRWSQSGFGGGDESKIGSGSAGGTVLVEG